MKFPIPQSALRLRFGRKVVGLAAFPRLPRQITPGSPDSLTGAFWFETLQQPRMRTGCGGTLRAYRTARSRIAHNRRYAGTGEMYIPFAGPKGILP